MTAEEWALSEAAAILGRAEGGRSVTTAALREELGLGHEDLRDVLDVLREQGGALEAAPGEWRPPYDDERPSVSSEGAGERESDGPGAEQPGADRSSALEPLSAPSRVLVGQAEQIRLTHSVLAAMDSETIGKIVQAGANEADSKVPPIPFVLRVDP